MATTWNSILQKASETGLLSAEQVEPLANFLSTQPAGTFPGSAAPSEEPNIEEDSEIPRFIRGYHDILITIGIVITLAGIAGLASALVALPAVIILAEIFVRRQRLALPSFVLTLAFAICTGAINESLLVDENSKGSFYGLLAGDSGLIQFAVLQFVLMSAFYWRYRVPVAKAGLVASGVLTIVGVALMPIGLAASDYYIDVLLLLSGAIVIAYAIYLDLGDPRRLTRNSDVAFWLYLIAVPAALRGIFALVGVETPVGATIVLVAVIAMMKIGLLLDRRAFITAGLIYLGYAFSTLFDGAKGWFGVLAGGSQFLWIILAIGVIVLAVGFGWRTLRAWLLSMTPESLRDRLPVMR